MPIVNAKPLEIHQITVIIKLPKSFNTKPVLKKNFFSREAIFRCPFVSCFSLFLLPVLLINIIAFFSSSVYQYNRQQF